MDIIFPYFLGIMNTGFSYHDWCIEGDYLLYITLESGDFIANLTRFYYLNLP